MCLVLGSSDLNYETKQMEVGDALLPQVTSQQIGTQSLKVCLHTSTSNTTIPLTLQLTALCENFANLAFWGL